MAAGRARTRLLAPAGPAGGRPRAASDAFRPGPPRRRPGYPAGAPWRWPGATEDSPAAPPPKACRRACRRGGRSPQLEDLLGAAARPQVDVGRVQLDPDGAAPEFLGDGAGRERAGE